MKATDIRARILAVVAGVALLLSLAFATESRAWMSQLIFSTIYIAGFTVVGILVGFLWPSGGWRLGLYVCAILPLFLLGSILFSDPPPVIHWKEELLGLL